MLCLDEGRLKGKVGVPLAQQSLCVCVCVCVTYDGGDDDHNEGESAANPESTQLQHQNLQQTHNLEMQPGWPADEEKIW